ncbi:hypothetical protein ACJMK2_005595 [Sinanodonta woodiana]|uniref:Receptor protein-tyrosine kinase n=1 Tax=Sinanodonta woodiana TaxID=1069815 RepID=A0ABD3VS51_SINWO
METALCVVLVFIACVNASIWTNLAKFSDITSSHTCNSSGSNFVCNNACQVTDSTNVSYDKPFLNESATGCGSLNVSVKPTEASKDNGYIIFGEENCTHTKNITYDGTSWTISFWVKYNGTIPRTLLEVRSNSAMLALINTNNSQIGKNKIVTSLQIDSWTLIVLRMTNKNATYLAINSTTTFVGVMENISRPITILFGPQTNSSPPVYMIDARIYNYSLTDREITKLFNGNLAPKLALQDQCLCPRDFPTVIPGQQNYGIKCTDHTNTTIYRLNNNANHPVQYAVDEDENTYWNSGTTASANITLDLKNVFQISSIEIHFLLDTSPSDLVFNLTYKGKSYTSTICGCNSSLSCRYLRGNFTYNLTNGIDLKNRTSYSTLLAKTVAIQLNGSCNNKTFYAISEIIITGSCHCSLNSENCTILNDTNRTYRCACNNTSNTNGSNCETCNEGFWRNSTFDLTCQNNCSCNSIGSSNKSCDESDGQCVCKPNVVGQLCDQCNNTSYNFTSNGCTSCNCSMDGTINCNSTGQCLCKPFVETDSGKCQNCMPNYYGFGNSSGCTECGCNASGATSLSCNVTGECYCKSYVTGRACNQCIDSYWNLKKSSINGCVKCDCNIVGSVNDICDKYTGQCPCYSDGETSIANTQCMPVLKMTPTYGPMAGGTNVTLSGQHLGNQDVNVTVVLGSEPTRILTSGLCNIELKGEYLNNVYRPDIIVYGIPEAPNITGPCSHVEGDSTSIFCKPPNVSTWVTNGTYSYGIILDGITEFLNISTSMIEILPDPIFHTNGEIVYRNAFDKLITVKGERFSRACDKKDFRIHLSKRGDCEIKDFTDTEITCDPKESFPGTGEKETLKIYIGSLEKNIGMVEFRTFWKLQEFIYICVGVGAFVLIIIFTIIICCICRQRNKQNAKKDEMGLENIRKPSQKKIENDYVGVVNPGMYEVIRDNDKSYSELFLERLPQNVSELVKSSIIDKSHIEIGQICTVKGTYTRIINGKFASRSSTPFAGDGNTIKTLVEKYPAQGEVPKWLSLGLQECTRLRDVVHEKVLCLRGIAIDEAKIYVVYPAMERTLKDYMQKRYNSQAINVDDVIAFCFDVGEGMQELHRHGIVHKDLAARNCMVDSGKVAKVADASFASDLYPREYLKQQNRDLPIRWMAVESLQQTGFYDKATDMWSYGVLLWEVFTGCRCLPYEDLLDNDIHLHVAMQGKRLRQPENILKT